MIEQSVSALEEMPRAIAVSQCRTILGSTPQPATIVSSQPAPIVPRRAAIVFTNPSIVPSKASTTSNASPICKICGDIFKHERHLRKHKSSHAKIDEDGFPIDDWLEKYLKNTSSISESVYHGNLRDVGVGTALMSYSQRVRCRIFLITNKKISATYIKRHRWY
ncbi:hypothetical protein JTE90_014439 [Oedothorax gibbosus]|uniref:C2H2-type domain-containing protein n=1 Tax=Oedothorax gibbosus TaxID=931172 RepID=A0AAV6V2T8_9ARAC|nr:hypothetical protein JTE90_014439 [Oedothorax gibbosus]